MAASAKRRADGPAVKKKPKKPGDNKRRLKRVAIVVLVTGLVFGLLGVGAFVVAYNAVEIPDPNEDFEAQTSKIYYADGETVLGEFATQDRESIPLDEMPQTMKDAVVAAENQTFWTDKGIDPRGILRAAFSNAQGNATQGASTITQQYVKILYLTQERSLDRKVREAILSLKLQRKMSKEQVLEGYLNTIYFGRGAYGVEAAAQAFFDKPAAELTLRESAVLASVLNNPTNLDPANGKEAKQDLKTRYEYVLGSMADMGTISAAEAEQAKKRLPKFPQIEAQSQYGGQRGHMLKLVRDELLRLGYTEEDIDGGGLRVTTTFTQEAMAAAEEGQAEQRPEGMNGGQLHVAVATVEVGTGALLGFYGGQDYLDSQINWAVAGGMAGSTFKAFADTAAIEDGFSLKDTFNGNSPMVLPDGTDFENQGNASYGTVSMIEATAHSINTAFIDMTNSMEDGPQKIVDAANDLGIPGNEPGKYGIPHQVDRPPGQPRRRARQCPGQPDQHGQRLRHVGQQGHPRRRPRDRPGRHVQRRDRLQLQARDPRGRRPRHRRGRHLRAPAGRRGGLGQRGAGARPTRGRQDRDGDQRQGRGVLVVVRRHHAADLDRGHVRPRQGSRAARGLPPRVLRRLLPRPHLDRRHGPGDGGHGGRGVPGAGVRRRRRARGGSRALHARRRPRPSGRRRRSRRRP